MSQIEKYELSPLAQVPDYHLDNQPGFDFRTELNTILAALVSNNSGSTAPGVPWAGMFWLDTSSAKFVLRRRNSTNNGWLKVFDEDNAPTKGQVGLSNVPNYPATGSLTDGSASKFATAAATKALNDQKLAKAATAADSAKLGGVPADDYARKVGTYPNLRAQATTKTDVGLSNVQNYTISDSISLNSSASFASSKAVNSLNTNKLDKTGKAADSDKLDGKDSTAFADKVHSHSIGQVTGLQTALDGKLGKTAKAVSATIADKWTNARTITVAGNSTGSVSINGSANVTLTISNAFATDSTFATKLKTARSIGLSGDLSGSATFDGSANVTIAATITKPIAGVPIGGVIMWCSAAIPEGFIEMAGQQISKINYPELVALLTGGDTANIPDMRGEFPRGWDHGRNIDSGRIQASGQGQSYQTHNHTGYAHSHTHVYSRLAHFATTTTNVSWVQQAVPLEGWSGYAGTGNTSGTRISIRMHAQYTHSNGSGNTGVTINNNGSTETRPRNVALMFIIKATP